MTMSLIDVRRLASDVERGKRLDAEHLKAALKTLGSVERELTAVERDVLRQRPAAWDDADGPPSQDWTRQTRAIDAQLQVLRGELTPQDAPGLLPAVAQWMNALWPPVTGAELTRLRSVLETAQAAATSWTTPTRTFRYVGPRHAAVHPDGSGRYLREGETVALTQGQATAWADRFAPAETRE